MAFRTLILFSVVMTFMSASLYGDSQASIGVVIAADGPVDAINKAGESRKLSRRSALFVGDKIKVGPSGNVQFRLTEGSLWSIKEKSEVSVDTYLNAGKENDAFSATVNKGSFRTLTGAISKSRPGNYKISTPVATMGVRGTFYSCSFDDTSMNLNCSFYRGSGCLENSQGELCLGSGNRFDYAHVNGAESSPDGTLVQPAAFNEYSIDQESLQSADSSNIALGEYELEPLTDEVFQALENDLNQDWSVDWEDMDEFEDESDLLEDFEEHYEESEE